MMLRDLGWLVTVADLEHVTDAAAVIGIPQPTLSRAIARVESELGARVFERVPDGVRVTPAGELVVAAARDLDARHTQLVDDLATMLDPDTGVVRLAFLDSMAGLLVPRLLRDFHRVAPRVRLVLRQEPSREIVDDLASGAADLAITTRQDGRGWAPLLDEREVLVVPAGHRLAGRKRVALSDLADEELVSIPPGFGYRQLVDDLLRTAGIAPTISFESQDLATIEGLVAAGLGVAIVPEHFAGASGTVGITIAGASVRRSIGLVWRTDRELSPAAVRFRDFVVGQTA
ncbi:LysR family transcriptional regulator [Nocardioides sp. Root1257]|uniref:LysR family transcriptional regulator n=1 Tax=unclassified Nocardioides TaxID=2615069 RepID=UPI0006F425B3|nr:MULTISPECIES: LysR family transcriptional regulator [unclassified Nocardioides]KQW49018.1 LysR family transcriptional regulator [Nocardioides sp. Root1257]KRC48192.1 LysR family transcriptional regulator [Nocardioides sp. Root224]